MDDRLNKDTCRIIDDILSGGIENIESMVNIINSDEIDEQFTDKMISKLDKFDESVIPIMSKMCPYANRSRITSSTLKKRMINKYK